MTKYRISFVWSLAVALLLTPCCAQQSPPVSPKSDTVTPKADTTKPDATKPDASKPNHPTPDTSTPESKAMSDFEAKVKDYLALHKKLEATLPKLSDKATPEEIDKNQRALATLIQSARSNAKQGEFFTPVVEAQLRGAFAKIFIGKDGKNLKGSIMDENPGLPKLDVNGRYPDSVPLSTMPPEVLEILPKLEEDMEYRFVGEQLVLLDAHPHLIVDFTGDVLPN